MIPALPKVMKLPRLHALGALRSPRRKIQFTERVLNAKPEAKKTKEFINTVSRKQKLAGSSLFRLNGYVTVTVLLLVLPEYDFGLWANIL